MKLEDAHAALDNLRRHVQFCEDELKEGNLVRAASRAADLEGMALNAFNRVYDLAYPKPEGGGPA